MTRATRNDYRIMSQAVREWYRYYEVEWDDQASSVLCDEASALLLPISRGDGDDFNREVCWAPRYSHQCAIFRLSALTAPQASAEAWRPRGGTRRCCALRPHGQPVI